MEFFLTVFDKLPLISCDSRLFQSNELRWNNTTVHPSFLFEIIRVKGIGKNEGSWTKAQSSQNRVFVSNRCWRLPPDFVCSERRIRWNVSKVVKQLKTGKTVSHHWQYVRCTVPTRSSTRFHFINIDIYHGNPTSINQLVANNIFGLLTLKLRVLTFNCSDKSKDFSTYTWMSSYFQDDIQKSNIVIKLTEFSIKG